METKVLEGKEIKIRRVSKKDLKSVDRFRNFLNSLVSEDALVRANKRMTLKDETFWLKEELKKIREQNKVYLVAEDKNKIVGSVDISLGHGRENHVCHLGISIRKGYRNIGLGTYLVREITKLAKKELKTQPKIIRLSAYSINKEALAFYKELGFRQAARIPKQAKFKGRLIDEIIMLKEI